MGAATTTRRRLWPRILGAVVVTLAIIIAAGYWYARPLLLTGTGYAAHNACAVTKLAGRDNPEADLPPNPLVPYLRTRVDDDSARTTLLGLLAGQRAYYTDGFGCTLADKRPDLPAPTPVTTTNPLLLEQPDPASAGVQQAVALAFGDDLSAEARAQLGTRAVVVVHEGRLVIERYADDFDKDTRQLGWSMAKSATNLLTGILVAEGKIDIHQAGLMGWTGDSAGITLDHLLRMTSGLAWDETYDLGTPITDMLYAERDMGAFAAKQTQAHPVGTFEQYSSGSTNIVCSVLDQATGEGANLPRRALFEPLGLTSAVWEVDGAGVPVCSSYLWATPREWAAIGQFALDDGVVGGTRLLPEGWMAESTTAVAVAQAEDPGYGASWWVNRHPDGTLTDATLPPDTYWAQGHDGQRVFVVPSADLVVVRMGFSPTSPDLRMGDVVASLITELG